MSRMPCSTGDSSARGRSTCGMKLSRREGASRITPCSSVLYHSASASLKSSLSRICASISPASWRLSVPLKSQAYTPCRANSRARRRALRALLREAPPAAPRDLLVVKIVFLVVVIVVLVIVRLGLERSDEIGHFYCGTCAVATLFVSTHLGLFLVFRGQHAVGDGNTRFQGNATNGRSTFVADDLEVIGFTSDDRAQCDKCIKFEGFSHLGQGNPQFQSAGNRHNHDVAFIDAELGKFRQARGQFSLADFLVKTGTHNTDMQAFAI